MIVNQQSMRDLVELVTGGLQITTGLDGRPLLLPAQTAPYTGKQFNAKGIRTVIQPDMDVMTVLSPEVLAIEGLWEKHTAVIEQKLAIIYTLQRWVQRSWAFFLLFPSIWIIYGYFHIGFPDVWRHALESAVITALIYLSKRWIARGFSWAIGRYLRTQLQKYIG